MPEVVEVFMTIQYLKHFIYNTNITNIKILGGRYERNNMNGLHDVIIKFPLKITNVCSKGKFIWFVLCDVDNNKLFMLNTLGLEGKWSFYKSKYSRVQIELDGNKQFLYFNDLLNFGTMQFTYDKYILEKKLNNLNYDLLVTPFTEKEFRDRLHKVILKSHGGYIEIVKVLMNQTKSGIGCGIGNYLSAEILYNAKISPHKFAIHIYNDKKMCYMLSKSIKYIIKLSFMTADVGYIEDLDIDMIKWIKHMRKNIYHIHDDINIKTNMFVFNVYRKKKDNNGNDVIGDKIIKGRTTYWCPSVQK
jgi:formamidopyrimidine-DNA glycosylase